MYKWKLSMPDRVGDALLLWQLRACVAKVRVLAGLCVVTARVIHLHVWASPPREPRTWVSAACVCLHVLPQDSPI